MLPIRPTSGFKKDLKRAGKQRPNIKKVIAIRGCLWELSQE